MDAGHLLSSAGWDSLFGLALNELPPADADEIRALAAQHPAVARRLEHALGVCRTLSEARNQADAWTVSPAQRSKLLALGRLRSPGWLKYVTDAVNEMIAGLVFDSGVGKPLAGFRGAGNARSMVYQAEGAELELRVAPVREGEVSLIGQVHASPPARKVWLRSLQDDAEAIAQVDESGLFETQLRAGVYEAAVLMDGAQMVIPTLELRSSES